MTKSETTFLEFIRCIVNGNNDEVARLVKIDPSLATKSADAGATAQDPATYYFAEISHYLYRGDTALHMAAAAFQRPIGEFLVEQGADLRARNRRGAEPLHYASDTNHWDPVAQAGMISFLASKGADLNSRDKNGVTPLHRAVRTRSLPAVQALLDSGVDPMLRNSSGSTPLHLAVQNTGRGGSGTDHAKD